MSPGERCLPAPSPAGAPEEGSGDATAVCFSLRSREKRGQRHAETKMSGQQRHRPNPGDDLRDLRELVSASSPLYGQRLSRPLPPRGAAVPPRPRNLSRGDPGGSRCGPCGRGSGREEERRDGVARGWQPAAGGRAVRGLKQVTPLREPGSGGGEAPTAGREGGRAVPRSPQGPCGTRSSGSPPRAGAVLTPVWGSLALCQPPLPVLPPSPF